MRIYLDTNILTKLDDHPQLKAILDRYSEYLNIVYSEAHIDDLSRSGNREKTIEDLTRIRELTHGQCMAKYQKQQHVTYQKRDPVEFYETTLETSFSAANLEGLDQIFDGVDFAELGMQDPIETLNSALATFKETVLDNLSSPEYDYSTLFKQSGQQLSMQSLITDMMNLVNGSPESKAFFQHARKLMDEHVEQRKSLSNQTDPIAHLNSILPGSAMGRSFEDFNAMAMEIFKTNFTDQGEKERFVTSYSNLDLMGFRADSKMSVQNINTDATHAYFAGHCELFITQDQKLSAKAEAVYREFGTDTIIVDVARAVKLMPELIPLTGTLEDLIAEIGTHSRAGIVECHSEVANRITSTVSYLDKFMLGFFDEYLEHSYPDGGFLTVYYKSIPTFNKWLYSREYMLLTNKLVAILGHDNYGNGEFGDWSSEFPAEEPLWRGRYWGNKNVQIVLKQTDEFGISLFIDRTSVTGEQNSDDPSTGPDTDM